MNKKQKLGSMLLAGVMALSTVVPTVFATEIKATEVKTTEIKLPIEQKVELKEGFTNIMELAQEEIDKQVKTLDKRLEAECKKIDELSTNILELKAYDTVAEEQLKDLKEKLVIVKLSGVTVKSTISTDKVADISKIQSVVILEDAVKKLTESYNAFLGDVEKSRVRSKIDSHLVQTNGVQAFAKDAKFVLKTKKRQAQLAGLVDRAKTLETALTEFKESLNNEDVNVEDVAKKVKGMDKSIEEIVMVYKFLAQNNLELMDALTVLNNRLLSLIEKIDAVEPQTAAEYWTVKNFKNEVMAVKKQCDDTHYKLKHDYIKTEEGIKGINEVFKGIKIVEAKAKKIIK